MKLLISILIFFVCPLLCYGKYNKQLNGHIIANGKKINFFLNYSITKNKILNGISITGKGTKEETKCRIKGTYNAKNGQLFFYETVVLSSKATFKNLNFCLLTAKLKRKITKNKLEYTGNFTGYVRGSKKKCAQGTVYLSAARTKKAITPTVKKIKPKPAVKKIKVDTLYSRIQDKKTIEYTYHSNTLLLTIWDDANVDGDRVSIFLDGKSVLKNYVLLKTKKQLKLNLQDKEKHFIKVVALNEGKASPNTSKIQLKFGNTAKVLRAHIRTNEFVYISLKKGNNK